MDHNAEMSFRMVASILRYLARSAVISCPLCSLSDSYYIHPIHLHNINTRLHNMTRSYTQEHQLIIHKDS